MILISGASGTVGRAVLEEVHQSGVPVRAMYRNKKDLSKAPEGVETIIADFGSKETLAAALSGVRTAYVVCSPIAALVELESSMIDACLDNGVKHVVLSSALGAEDYPKSFPSWHRQVENRLRSSGLDYTILRPNTFMQNIVAYNAPNIRTQGAFHLAMGGARISFIDVRDVAAAAAKVLLAPAEHAGKTYELNGPEAVTYSELAERISKIANTKVNFVDIPEEAQQKAMLNLGMPESQVTPLLELQQYYTGGQGGEVTDTLARLLGHEPRTLNHFLEESKDQFRSEAANA